MGRGNRRGQNNGVGYGYTCPFCGRSYGITNFSYRDPPPGAEGVSPDPPEHDYSVKGPGMWTPHTVKCWTEKHGTSNEPSQAHTCACGHMAVDHAGRSQTGPCHYDDGCDGYVQSNQPRRGAP